MHNTLRIATFNIHKGLTQFNARFSLREQRELLRRIQPDVVFLQEVRDEHEIHRARYQDWPVSGQASFLADAVWPNFVYGKNSVYPAGHHGNAILSKFPIIQSYNIDISAHSTEQRGMLHCVLEVPGWHMPLHAICVHLGLFARWRHAQLDQVGDYIAENIPHDAPLMIAGDFNDWTTRAGNRFATKIGLHEVFEHHTGYHARSFPSFLPLFRLDRVYVRGFHIKQTQVYAGASLLKISDHAVLSALLTRR
jgi:endonuclease/exonuclease/phosphatase family metal-dependent hydrolase